MNQKLGNNPIAVIGMSAMFADALNLEQYWENILNLKDSIKDVPLDRWKIEDYYDPNFKAEDKTYCKRGGFLPDIDFDPMEFGLPPNLLESTDVSQLISLVAAKDAFADAGYDVNSDKFTSQLRAKTGVILGVGGGQKLISPLMSRLQYPVWEKALRASNINENEIPGIVAKIKKAYIGWNEDTFPGLLGNIVAGRITNRFDLGGVNSVVDAACAASLSAINMAVNELLNGHVDMILTGGVDTDNSPFMYMSFSKTPAFSLKGEIKPFDDSGDGMLIGEGIGMVVLKRLADAQRDGDRIYATINGIGTSSDGKFKSIYAPRSSGQVLAMKRAYEDAGYEAHTIGLIEAHGTGTKVGDATELTSMLNLFDDKKITTQNVALGSVKSQIGHTKAAAGAAGFIKAVLALYHKILPGTINVNTPNKLFDFETTPFYINTQNKPWILNKFPRRASLSAFGFGGVNVHITLEEFQNSFLEKDKVQEVFYEVIISENNEEKLLEKCAFYKNKWLENKYNFQQFVNENDIETLQPLRLAFVCKNNLHAVELLSKFIEKFEHDKDILAIGTDLYFVNKNKYKVSKVATLFSGQGSQSVNMGVELAMNYKEVFDEIEAFENEFVKVNATSLSKIMYPPCAFTKEKTNINIDKLTQTQFAQPAIGAMGLGQYKLLQSRGFKTDYVGGHSFGEFTALCAANVIDENTFRYLAVQRGKIMGQNSLGNDKTSLLAIKSSEEIVIKYLVEYKSLSLANVNSTNQVVVGGLLQDLNRLKEVLSNNKIESILLNVAMAFHTKHVEAAQKQFAKVLDKCNFLTPKVPVIQNYNGLPYENDSKLIKRNLQNHMQNTVQFKKQIDFLYNAGVKVFVEFGTKNILSNLVKETLAGKDFQVISTIESSSKSADLQLKMANLKLILLGYSNEKLGKNSRKRIILKKPSITTVKLNGGLYTSEKTKKAYINELEKVSLKVHQEKVEIKDINSTINNNTDKNITKNLNKMQNQEFLNLMHESLAHLKEQQAKTLKSFEAILTSQHLENQAFMNLMAQSQGINNIAINTFGHNNFEPSVEKSLPIENLPIVPVEKPVNVEQTVKNYSSTATPELIIDEPKLVVIEKNVESNSLVPQQGMAKILLEIVSEKTGYPIEMLDLEMDMEADLGIDSIKRVEIFGSVAERNPAVGKIDPRVFAELRTLQEVLNKVTLSDGEVIKSEENVKETISTPSVQDSNIEIAGMLLEVVSEKTGYPVEMLELGMDMEADLGIDSIKRVEIFGKIKEQVAEASVLDPRALAELRTLQEVVNYVTNVIPKK